MDQLLEIRHIKTETTKSTSIDQLEIPTEMQKEGVDQESNCLIQSEMYIKMEPQEDEVEYAVIAGTSYGIYVSGDTNCEIYKPTVKNECKGLPDEVVQDPLNVDNETKDKEYFPVDLHGESKIKTEPTERQKDERFLESDADSNSHRSESNRQVELLIKKDPDSRDKKYICDVCNKTFTYKHVLKVHLRIHTGDKPFNCDICKKPFSQKGNLDAHMLIHSGEKSYVCDLCKKVFARKSTLNEHMLIHSDKKFSCSQCKKSFTHKYSLARHKRVHTGDKPFTCFLCNKKFTQRTSLIQHRSLHTGEKPYSCDICHRSFAQKSNLIRHKRIHKK